MWCMSSGFSLAVVALSGVVAVTSPGAAQSSTSSVPPLRVCADPNNLPFSNQRGEGFENKIAAVVARDLHRPLTYYWMPQRRGFLRSTLNANRCDVVVGVPAALDA